MTTARDGVVVVIMVGKRGRTIAPPTRDDATAVAANVNASWPGRGFLSVDQ